MPTTEHTTDDATKARAAHQRAIRAHEGAAKKHRAAKTDAAQDKASNATETAADRSDAAQEHDWSEHVAFAIGEAEAAIEHAERSQNEEAAAAHDRAAQHHRDAIAALPAD